MSIFDNADAIEIWGMDSDNEPILDANETPDYFAVFIHKPGEGLHHLQDFRQHDFALSYANYCAKRYSLEVNDYGQR